MDPICTNVCSIRYIACSKKKGKFATHIQNEFAKIYTDGCTIYYAQFILS